MVCAAAVTSQPVDSTARQCRSPGLKSNTLTAVDTGSNEQCSPLSLQSAAPVASRHSHPIVTPRRVRAPPQLRTASFLSTMPRRRAARRAKQSGEGQTHLMCQTSPPAAAAAGRDPRDAALARAQLAPLIVTHTLRLIDAIQMTDGSCVQRVQWMVDLLKEDTRHPESLLDLSLPMEGSRVSLFPHCIHSCLHV